MRHSQAARNKQQTIPLRTARGWRATPVENQRMLSSLSVCLSHDNFWTTKYRTIKLDGYIGTLHKNLARVRRWRSKVKVSRGKKTKNCRVVPIDNA